MLNLRPLAAIGALALAAAVSAPALAHPARHVVKHPAPSFVTANAKKKTVNLLLEAGVGTANNGLNFDGYANGQMVVTVPAGWTVDVTFKNVGGLPHSVVFVPGKANINSLSPKPAFPGAESPDPIQGTAPGASAVFHFVAKAGTYKFLCAFPGHSSLGQWDTFIVRPGLKAPTVKL